MKSHWKIIVNNRCTCRHFQRLNLYVACKNLKRYYMYFLYLISLYSEQG